MDRVRAIADAVLYEGYLLWPYRMSAMKNQQRFTFGGVYPPAWSSERPDDPSLMQAQCLLESEDAGEAAVDVRVRFLHVVERQVLRAGAAAAGWEPVAELEVDGERHLSWQEATERDVVAEGLSPEALVGPDRADPDGVVASPLRVAIDIPAGSELQTLTDAGGRAVGALRRSWQALRGTLEIRSERVAPTLRRLTVRVSNATTWSGGTRERALAHTLCSTHIVLATHGGAFVSLTDPPARLQSQAAACENRGVWPVLAGEPGDRGTLLCSPIILPDHPQIAPESPGDLFDGGEIDQMLVLNILALTDEEKGEMRASDPRAREILDRTESLSQEQMMRLGGAIREFGLVRR
jgi:hypothetical protein